MLNVPYAGSLHHVVAYIANVALVTDGCHVPYIPQKELTKKDYKNYKGWTSLLLVAFVNSFHLFVEVEAGHAGKSGDSPEQPGRRC